MRIRIRSGYRAPFDDSEPGSIAYGARDRTGSARAAAPDGAEARGVRDRRGSAQHLLVRVGLRDREGRASAQTGARGVRDRTGRATASSATVSGVYVYDYVLAPHDDLTAVTITDYVARLHFTGDQFKQAPTGRVTNPDGWDIIVQTAGGAANLDHEIEFYDGTNGVLDLNFRIPSYATGTAYPFRLKIGSLT